MAVGLQEGPKNSKYYMTLSEAALCFVTSLQKYSLNKRQRPMHKKQRLCHWALSAKPGLTVFTLGALLSEGNRREHVKGMLTTGLTSHMQRVRASAHHVIAASVLLNTDVALGTLRRQKGAIRLTHHRAGSKTNYTKLPAPVLSNIV